MKRVFDLVIGGAALILLSPIALLGACLVRLKMGEPVLFRQVRPGLRGEPFVLVKLRTMTGSEEDEKPDSDRITHLGRVLRATSVDELPELWNVLRGQMSLVGPRPLLTEYLSLYSREQMRRHDVRPGITGLAQVLDRNDTTWERRLRLDVWYVDHQSVWLDLKILAMTVGRVLSRQGVSARGEATMPRFEGQYDE